MWQLHKMILMARNFGVRPYGATAQDNRLMPVRHALRILLVIAFTYPVWGVAYEVVTGYWPQH